MRKWLLNLHLYGGLLCAPYLIIFGFSSLHFNHHFGFVEAKPNARSWEAPLNVEPLPDNEATATSVRDSLSLMGWTIPWKMKRDAAGDLQFDLERPGKSYTIRTLAGEHKVRVEERRKGFWQVFNSLHALGKLPNSRFVLFWGWYTEVCTWFVVFAAASGLYLWIDSRRERRVGLIALVLAVTCAGGLICFIVLHG
jgi:hypothetical protein